MFASITLATVNPDRIADIQSLYEKVVPTLRESPGWLGITVVVNRSTGSGHLFGLWESETDALAFETGGTFQAILSEYPPGLLTSAPTRSVGEVIFQARR